MEVHSGAGGLWSVLFRGRGSACMWPGAGTQGQPDRGCAARWVVAFQGQAWKWPGVTLWLQCPPGGWECGHSGPQEEGWCGDRPWHPLLQQQRGSQTVRALWSSDFPTCQNCKESLELLCPHLPHVSSCPPLHSGFLLGETI